MLPPFCSLRFAMPSEPFTKEKLTAIIHNLSKTISSFRCKFFIFISKQTNIGRNILCLDTRLTEHTSLVFLYSYFNRKIELLPSYRMPSFIPCRYLHALIKKKRNEWGTYGCCWRLPACCQDVLPGKDRSRKHHLLLMQCLREIPPGDCRRKR